MTRHGRLVLVALLSGVILGIAAGGASASWLSTSSRTFRATWSSLEFRGGGATVRCALSLEGSFHASSFYKIADSLQGMVNRAALGACTGGTATLLSATLPWHVRYESFTGTLPNITGVRLKAIGMSFSIFPTGLFACLARTTEAAPGRFTLAREAGGGITGISPIAEAGIPLTGSGFCTLAGNGTLSGNGTFSVQGSTAQVRVTLIEGPNITMEVTAGEEAAISFVIIENPRASRVNIRIEDIILAGNNPGNFRVRDDEPCRGRELRPGELCTFEVIRIAPGGDAIVEARTSHGTLRRRVP